MASKAKPVGSELGERANSGLIAQSNLSTSGFFCFQSEVSKYIRFKAGICSEVCEAMKLQSDLF